jgi:transmembrane sensor
MNEGPESTPSRSQLREEAATWFVVMRGPEADARRDEFNKWLARGALHRRAYNSVAETFNLGKRLKTAPAPMHDDSPPAGGTGRSPSRRIKMLLGFIVAGGVGVSGITWTWNHVHLGSPQRSEVAVNQPRPSPLEARYSTGVGEIGKFVLADGSKLTLDTNSVVLAAFTPTKRELRLMHGRARFFVAHEARPFEVRANGSTIVARGTIFDVALLEDERVAVHLIKGAIDVTNQASPQKDKAGKRAPGSSVLTRMTQGQALIFGASSEPQQSTPAHDQDWPNGVVAFDDISLFDLLTEVNRYAKSPIRLADPTLGRLRISGTFNIHDTRHMAEQIADFLSLAVIYPDNGYTLSRTCPAKITVPCRPPT